MRDNFPKHLCKSPLTVRWIRSASGKNILSSRVDATRLTLTVNFLYSCDVYIINYGALSFLDNLLRMLIQVDWLMPEGHVWFLILFFECHRIVLYQKTSLLTKNKILIYLEYVAWILLKVLMFLMCHNIYDKCLVLNQAILRPPFCFFKISHTSITANSCIFFSILSLSFSPSHVGFFRFLSSASVHIFRDSGQR